MQFNKPINFLTWTSDTNSFCTYSYYVLCNFQEYNAT